MNKIAQEIRNYWFTQSPFFILEPDVLDKVVQSLTDEEKKTILTGDEGKPTGDQASQDAYLFAVHKAFNRHNDIITGATTVNNGTVLCTEKACITELDISAETLKDCNKHCIYHICDVEKDILPGLSLEAIADLTAAIISYNETHTM
jgi:hypothetical protein